MKNRVHVLNATYYIDEVNKVVVCKLKCDMQMFRHPAYYYFTKDDYEKRFPLVSGKGIFNVVAKARCNATDTFDVEKGKRLAESRAKAKMLHVAERVWATIAKAIAVKAEDCIKTANACLKAKNVELNHVRELEQE